MRLHEITNTPGDYLLTESQVEEMIDGPADAADLGRCHRGVEPLRIVVMPQRITRVTVAPLHEIGPMPVVV